MPYTAACQSPTMAMFVLGSRHARGPLFSPILFINSDISSLKGIKKKIDIYYNKMVRGQILFKMVTFSPF